MDLQGFREDKGVEDYYKSTRDLFPEEGTIEWFFDNLQSTTNWPSMQKGETKEVGTICAYCVDRIESSTEIKWFEENDCYNVETLLMLTYDEYPDDTIKLKFKFDGYKEDGNFEINEVNEIFYLDSEENDFPYDYSVFLELDAAVKAAL